ncbi:MAG: bifunctional (p)ppGpp synthetase/guanosine-3',5'-bis(diphosphate) 3'-pyrophosphohydrolase [Bacteroidales bacterium]|jgi:GTP pyrophosphokinase|nr:bifunctional (p)ppGpp synthetase/guanosine-3',5'-bis(diphosphate) 3'-pyrophosphohydrolase [Bacteroidales bacterium]
MTQDAIDRICAFYSESDAAMIRRAYDLACTCLEGKARSNNHPFIEHPLAVAEIVARELGLGADAAAAVFLHEATRQDNAILDTVKGSFDKVVIDMAVSLNKISEIKPKDTRLEADRYRKLIASYSSDPKVFLIKLADRLEIMRNLGILPKSDQARKNAETILLYVPLAHQTGVYNVKSELEDLWLKYADPAQYRAISNQLKAGEKEREALVKEFVRPLEDKLRSKGIKYTLKARTKSAYSIWRKMQAQDIPFSKVYDVFAIRFIIDAPLEKEKDLCWEVYSLVTEEYEPDTSRLRDWITVPKPNGYQSLQITVKNSRGQFLEVQIRTERMDYEAELGSAAHWSYKGVKKEESLQHWLDMVHGLISGNSQDNYEQIDSVLNQDVFVFTPNGELRQLRAGATVLDFAFDIHSNIGLKCSGAKIGSKMVSIKEKLKTGDVVEILTNKNQKPNAGWLDFVVTSKARAKIKQRLKEEENKMAREGKQLLERRLKNWKLELPDDDLTYLVKKYKFRTANELFSALGSGDVDVADIKAYLLDKASRVQETVESHVTHALRKTDSSDYLVIGGNKSLKNVDYKMARCCNPVFGDEVFGFVTVNDGIKIHRMSCPNASRLLTLYPHRVQKVRWKEDASTNSFQTTVRVTVESDSAVNEVISTISMFKASIRAFYVKDARNGEKEVTATIFVPGNLELDKIIASLKKLKDARQVTRI